MTKPLEMTRRKSTRTYWVGTDRYVTIKQEYDMKFGRKLWFVVPYPEDGRTLLKVPTFAEAKAFVKAGAQ